MWTNLSSVQHDVDYPHPPKNRSSSCEKSSDCWPRGCRSFFKFALLHALADLAVQKGDGSGAPLDLDTRDIATEFIRLYWPQSRPFQVGSVTTNLILKQSIDKQATIITEITKTQQDWPPATVFRHLFLFFFSFFFFLFVGRGVRAEQRLQVLACSFSADPHLVQRRVFSFMTNAVRGRVPISSLSPQTAVWSGFLETPIIG